MNAPLRIWRGIDLAAAAVMHGVLLWVWQPLVGWAVWGFAVAGIAVAVALGDLVSAAVGSRVARWAIRVYAAAITVGVAASWGFAWFHAAPGALAVVLVAIWLAWLLGVSQEGPAATVGAALLAATWLPAADLSLVAMAWAAPALALGVAAVVVALFAGRTGRLGRRFVALFFAAAATMGLNAGFLHGVDLDVSHLRDRETEGIVPVFIWDNRPQFLKESVGTELRYAQADPDGRLLFGSDNGVFKLEERGIRPLPLGAAADNMVFDDKRHHAYLGTREGRVAMLTEADLAISAETTLPHGARVVRLGDDGVWAADRWRWVGLYDRYTLKELRGWRTRPITDIAADGRGGVFVASWDGTLRHFAAGGAEHAATLPRGGLFHVLAVDTKSERVFAANLLGTTLQVRNAGDLSPRQEIEIGRGGKSLLWAPELNALVVGRYFDGELIVLTDDPLRIVGRLNVGRRLRGVTAYGPKRILAASAAGVFAVDLIGLCPSLYPATGDRPAGAN